MKEDCQGFRFCLTCSQTWMVEFKSAPFLAITPSLRVVITTKRTFASHLFLLCFLNFRAPTAPCEYALRLTPGWTMLLVTKQHTSR